MSTTINRKEKDRLATIKIVNKLARSDIEPIRTVIASSVVGRVLLSEEVKRELMSDKSLRIRGFMIGAEVPKEVVKIIHTAPRPRARHTIP